MEDMKRFCSVCTSCPFMTCYKLPATRFICCFSNNWPLAIPKLMSGLGTSVKKCPNSISKQEPAILCGGLLRLWETPATFARKSAHLDPVLRSTFIIRHYCRQTWIMPLFKLITTLILQRTLAMVLNCCKILVVIYFKYYKQWLIMTLYLTLPQSLTLLLTQRTMGMPRGVLLGKRFAQKPNPFPSYNASDWGRVRPYMAMLHCCYSKFCYWHINIRIVYWFHTRY
jgi:hypothetical protein